MSLVSLKNPEGQVTNSNLELAVSMVYHACMEYLYNVWQKNTLSRNDKTAGLWWQRKGSTTSISPLAHLLHLQAMHQRFHSYTPRHDFVRGVNNGI